MLWSVLCARSALIHLSTKHRFMMPFPNHAVFHLWQLPSVLCTEEASVPEPAGQDRGLPAGTLFTGWEGGEAGELCVIYRVNMLTFLVSYVSHWGWVVKRRGGDAEEREWQRSPAFSVDCATHRYSCDMLFGNKATRFLSCFSAKYLVKFTQCFMKIN